jgi:hypothetical protein
MLQGDPFGTDPMLMIIKTIRGLSPQANYTDRATAACRRS